MELESHADSEGSIQFFIQNGCTQTHANHSRSENMVPNVVMGVKSAWWHDPTEIGQGPLDSEANNKLSRNAHVNEANYHT